MFYQDLFKLHTEIDSKFYDIELISYIDNYLGKFDKGTLLKKSDFEFALKNPIKVSKLLKDIENIGIVSKIDTVEDDEDEIYFEITAIPIKTVDNEYEKYLKNKRAMNSFEIIFKRLDSKKSGFFLLLDLKGYSKNINSKDKETRLLMHYFMDSFKAEMNKLMENCFFVKNNGLIVKQNGDGWLIYFEKIKDANDFVKKLIRSIKTNNNSKETMTTLKLNVKFYLHHIKEIEKIYRTDTLHFDIEGEDVIYLFLIEKKIEEEIYKEKECNFISYTKEAFEFLNQDEKLRLKRLSNIDLNIKDSSGNNKIQKEVEVFYEILD